MYLNVFNLGSIILPVHSVYYRNVIRFAKCVYIVTGVLFDVHYLLAYGRLSSHFIRDWIRYEQKFTPSQGLFMKLSQGLEFFSFFCQEFSVPFNITKSPNLSVFIYFIRCFECSFALSLNNIYIVLLRHIYFYCLFDYIIVLRIFPWQKFEIGMCFSYILANSLKKCRLQRMWWMNICTGTWFAIQSTHSQFVLSFFLFTSSVYCSDWIAPELQLLIPLNCLKLLLHLQRAAT